MLDEFEYPRGPARPQRPARRPGKPADPLPRLITRMVAASKGALRARLIQRLLTPLGTLGLAAIAAGAFAGFLQRRGAEGLRVSVEEAARYSGEQIAELVRFVGQVSPEALQAVANLIADNPVGLTAFSASAMVLLIRALGRSGAPDATN